MREVSLGGKVVSLLSAGFASYLLPRDLFWGGRGVACGSVKSRRISYPIPQKPFGE